MCLLKMRPTTIDTSGSGLWFRVLILVDPWVWKKLCWEENTHFVCAQGPWKRFVTAFARDNFIPIPWFPKKKIEYAKNGCGILYHFVHNILSVSFIIQKKRRIWFYESWTKVWTKHFQKCLSYLYLLLDVWKMESLFSSFRFLLELIIPWLKYEVIDLFKLYKMPGFHTIGWEM